MTAADVYEPAGTGLKGVFSAFAGSSMDQPFHWFRFAASPLTDSSVIPAFGKIVASATMMPLPIAVPR
jgi:hypothetical protein